MTFNGVNGFDRPRRYDAIPLWRRRRCMSTTDSSAAFRAAWGSTCRRGCAPISFTRGRGGARGPATSCCSRASTRSSRPSRGFASRAGWGRTAKLPSLGDLYPAPQFYDVVNVNWYMPDAAERLAVLTTTIKDPTYTRLGFSVGGKAEAGVEIDLGRRGASLSIVAFRDVTTGGVTYDPDGTFLLREHFALRDSITGTGRPPVYLTPAQSVDTVPVFIDRPRNMQRVVNRGVEWTLSLPELSIIQTRLELQGAWTVSQLSNMARYGPVAAGDQLSARLAAEARPVLVGGQRARGTGALHGAHHPPPTCHGPRPYGDRAVFHSREQRAGGATDTLAWAGYMARTGVFTPVPAAERGEAQYRDLRRQRVGIITVPASPAPDWIFQRAGGEERDGRGAAVVLRLQRLRSRRQAGDLRAGARLFPRLRFGVELTVPVALRGRGRGVRRAVRVRRSRMMHLRRAFVLAPLLGAGVSVTSGVLVAQSTGADVGDAPSGWRWSPLRSFGDLGLPRPGSPESPRLLELPAPRVGLARSAGNPAGLRDDIDSAGRTSSWRRALSPELPPVS